MRSDFRAFGEGLAVREPEELMSSAPTWTGGSSKFVDSEMDRGFEQVRSDMDKGSLELRSDMDQRVSGATRRDERGVPRHPRLIIPSPFRRCRDYLRRYSVIADRSALFSAIRSARIPSGPRNSPPEDAGRIRLDLLEKILEGR